MQQNTEEFLTPYVVQPVLTVGFAALEARV